MADSALVHNIQTLTDLKDALGRFAHCAQESLRVAESEVSRTQQWIQQRVWHWQRQVQQAHQALKQNQAVLNRCRSQVCVDRNGRRREPDCRAQERAVAAAERRLREMEAQLEKAKQWKARLESAVGKYHRHARRLQELTTTRTGQGRALLNRKQAELEKYSSLEVPGVSAAISPDQTQQTTGTPLIEHSSDSGEKQN